MFKFDGYERSKFTPKFVELQIWTQKDKRKYREMDLNVVQKILDKARPLLAVANKAKQR